MTIKEQKNPVPAGLRFLSIGKISIVTFIIFSVLVTLRLVILYSGKNYASGGTLGAGLATSLMLFSMMVMTGFNMLSVLLSLIRKPALLLVCFAFSSLEIGVSFFLGMWNFFETDYTPIILLNMLAILVLSPVLLLNIGKEQKAQS